MLGKERKTPRIFGPLRVPKTVPKGAWQGERLPSTCRQQADHQRFPRALLPSHVRLSRPSQNVSTPCIQPQHGLEANLHKPCQVCEQKPHRLPHCLRQALAAWESQPPVDKLSACVRVRCTGSSPASPSDLGPRSTLSPPPAPKCHILSLDNCNKACPCISVA